MKKKITITILTAIAMTFSVNAETINNKIHIEVIENQCDSSFKTECIENNTLLQKFDIANKFPCLSYTESTTVVEQNTVNKPNVNTTTEISTEATSEVSTSVSFPIETSTLQVYTEDTTETTTTSQINSGYSTQVLNLVNKYRKENGLKELTLNSDLSNVAQIKAEDMQTNNYFSHTSPTYGSPFDMMKQFGISYQSAGENIAKGRKTPDAVVNAWMNSEGHKANILNPNYTQMGLGYTNGTLYWCQMFIG